MIWLMPLESVYEITNEFTVACAGFALLRRASAAVRARRALAVEPGLQLDEIGEDVGLAA
jgi:hypothetical protein